MADVKAEIEITATDKASSEIEGVGKKSNKALKSVKRFAGGAARAFKGFTVAAVGINQGLEVMKKFSEVGRAAIEMTKLFRDENDPLIAQFNEASTSVQRLGAQVGDVLLVAFVGIAKALGPIIQKTGAWLEKNRNLLGQKLVEYMERFAKFTLVTAAKGLVLITKITSGWALLWPTLKTSVNTFFAGLFEGLAKGGEGLGNFLEKLGMDGLAGKIRSATATVRGFGEIFKDTADDSAKKVGDIINAQEQLEAKIERVGKATYEAIGEVATAATGSFIDASNLANQTIEQRNKLLEKEREKTIALGVQKTKEAEDDDERDRKRKSALDEFMAKVEEAEAIGVNIGSTISDSFIQGYASAEEGQSRMLEGLKSASASAVDMALERMQQEVTAAAASGAANAAASWGWAGPVVASAMAAAMFGLIRGFVQMGMTGMAEGGLVTGGVSGRDSVPTMLQPGEFVLTKEQTDSLRRGGGGGLGSQVVNIELNSTMPQSRAEIKRFVRQNVVPALRDLKAQGMY